MNIRAKIYFVAASLVLGLTSCAIDAPVEAPKVEKPEVSVTDAVPGQLLVRFDARVADALEQAGVTKSGVLSVDEILALVDGYHIERVFPVDPQAS